MRKRFTIILAALALVVSACGGSSPSGPDTSGGGGGPKPTPEPLHFGAGTYTIDSGGGGGVAQQFEAKSPGTLKVTLSWSPADKARMDIYAFPTTSNITVVPCQVDWDVCPGSVAMDITDNNPKHFSAHLAPSWYFVYLRLHPPSDTVVSGYLDIWFYPDS
jgi:hypothetical protein